MSTIEVIIIAIIEGLTEFLPVSSTGHMIITQSLLGVESTDFVKAFTVIIQFGAILSVVCLYWQRFFRLNPGQVTDWRSFIHKFDFYWKLLVAFLPAAIIGFLCGDWIDAMLENVWVVATMLVLGGIFMLFVDKLFNHPDESQEITEKKALAIGFFQCIAMSPGVSRSMATIVGGMAQRLSRKTAAEFSFFLAVPTMFGATCLETYKMLKGGEAAILSQGDNLQMLLLGSLVAFIVAILAIKFFINYVTRYGFAAFGWYRIVVGAIIIACGLCGVNLQMVD